MNLAKDSSNELLFVGFNQDSGCFACGTTDGFAVFNVDPFRETFRRIFTSGGIGLVEMLFRCNLIALVGGGRNPRYPTNKVMIWDDHQNKCIGELTFKTEVMAVKLRRDRVVVVLNTKVYVYRFSDLKLLDQIATLPNPKGLVSLCPEPSSNVLAVPNLARGSIRIELYDIEKATVIKAHDADLAQFALSSDGSRIASASEKGTLIRLWNCHTGEALRELRRGMDRAEIYCIAFNPSTTFLACSSDKGTVHIFSLTESSTTGQEGGGAVSQGPSSSTSGSSTGAGTGSSNSSGSNSSSSSGIGASSSGAGGAGDMEAGDQSGQGSTSNKSMGGLSFLRGVLPPAMIPKYAASEWSCAQMHGIEGKSICAFDRDNARVVVLSADGQIAVSSFEDGGECQRVFSGSFLRSADTPPPPASY